jgi:DNA invertase Pin-like site-specific DNA recombinase
MNAESKVTSEHLQRRAYLYIRQSTLRQVLENTESTQRQYALRQRARALGWPEDQIVVIDHDQGQSGASTVDREGFQLLVTEVGLGKAGIVMGLEVSRLARNCADWHRLLEICALTHTLILDEDGLYDPGHFNDRLLLGLKGTMSEAELHVLSARLRGGVLSKAQRAELKVPLPVGLVYDHEQKVMLDPDQQVQNSLRHLFATFERTGSAWATVRALRREGVKFPRRGQAGAGELTWGEPRYGAVRATLRNPRYSGTFCYGRTRTWRDAAGQWHCQQVPRDQWRFVRQEAHPGYVSWEQYQAHQAQLRANQQARGGGERKAGGAAREGPALLQGLVLCGKCGRSMTLRYHQRGGRLRPDYVCRQQAGEQTLPVCQSVPGAEVDEAVGQLLVQSVTPLALEVALQVQEELQARLDEADRLRQQHVQRAQYETDQARVRYMRVDPNNRLVADTLETLWNDKLRSLAQAKEECEKQRRLDAQRLTDEQKAQVLALASDFPKIWNDPKTPDRDRKRMARLLLEDVTLRREQQVIVQVRFQGGATHELRLPLPKPAWALWRTNPEAVAAIDQLLGEHTPLEIAHLLNQREWRSGWDCAFTQRMVIRLAKDHHLPTRDTRLRARGLLTPQEMAQLLDSKPSLVDYWREQGLLKGVRRNEKNEYYYERPSPETVQQIKQRRRLLPLQPLS